MVKKWPYIAFSMNYHGLFDVSQRYRCMASFHIFIYQGGGPFEWFTASFDEKERENAANASRLKRGRKILKAVH